MESAVGDEDGFRVGGEGKGEAGAGATPACGDV
jgi:hypothetical protein